jgi:hypothetical protein
MFRTRLAVAAVFVLAAACNSSDSPTDSSTGGSIDNAAITSDIANVAADGVAEDVDIMTGMDGSIGHTDAVGGDLVSPNGFRPGLTGCRLVGGTFVCPDTTRRGLDISRSVTFLDANGQDQTAYDSLTTASIHIMADIAGNVTLGPWAATVQRHRDLVITGLAGVETTRDVNGTGNETVSRSRVTRNDSTRSYDITGNNVITDVVMPVRPDGGNGWPVSGTITRTYTITLTSGPNAGKTVTRTVTITFNGTSNATAGINGATFTIDLGSHLAAPTT